MSTATQIDRDDRDPDVAQAVERLGAFFTEHLGAA